MKKAILPDTYVAADRQAHYKWPAIRQVQSVQWIGRWVATNHASPRPLDVTLSGAKRVSLRGLQFSDGRSIRSITITSTNPLADSSFRPNCC